MAYDVFISYSSKDAAASEAVYRALDEFGLSAFHAPRSIPAGRWLAEIESAITAGTPAVIVLASRAAASSLWVRQEVAWARATSGQREVPILVIELEAGARRLPGLDLAEFECLDLSGRGTNVVLDDETKDELWLRLHIRPGMQALSEVRTTAQRWCNRLLANDVDFWGDDWRRYLPDRVARDAPANQSSPPTLCDTCSRPTPGACPSSSRLGTSTPAGWARSPSGSVPGRRVFSPSTWRV
jgi:hypothetical protein